MTGAGQPILHGLGDAGLMTMTDFPNRVRIQEEGPREGFQFEQGQIPTRRKIELIDRLSETGLAHIQIVSFVHPKTVPGMADAEEVVRGITPAFGCNFEGDIPVERVIALTQQLHAIAAENGAALKYILLADTMAWATPHSIKRVLGAVRERFPDMEFALHLHDTRGMGIANAYAGLEMGVTRYDSSVAGLGGCPFAGHRGAAGNVCTEDFVFMCHEMGIETGIDLEALIDCAQLAEEIVAHPLPGSVMKGGSLSRLRARMAGVQT